MSQVCAGPQCRKQSCIRIGRQSCSCRGQQGTSRVQYVGLQLQWSCCMRITYTYTVSTCSCRFQHGDSSQLRSFPKHAAAAAATGPPVCSAGTKQRIALHLIGASHVIAAMQQVKQAPGCVSLCTAGTKAHSVSAAHVPAWLGAVACPSWGLRACSTFRCKTPQVLCDAD